MTRLLLLEGNTAAKRALAQARGVRNSSEIYALAIAAHYPQIALEVHHGADPGQPLPDWAAYDGLVVTGSSLHAYDTDFAVTNQIDLLRRAADHGLPVLGSCWGLQIAAMAAGGSVAASPLGREVGFARKIRRSAAGNGHPLLAGKAPVFDAPCIHYDEVTRLPAGATLLASNAHSQVQAAIVPLGRSEVWAVQYHPEYDLQQLVELYTLYEEDMIADGFFASAADLAAYCDRLTALATDPSDKAPAWQLGLDADVLDPLQRRGEIIAWIEHQVLRRA